jgi:hypothetical protein
MHTPFGWLSYRWWVPAFATINRGFPMDVFARTGCALNVILLPKITSARESKGGEMNRGIIGLIIGVLVIIILVIVILQLT